MSLCEPRSVDAHRPERVIAPIWRLALKRANPFVLLNEGRPECPIYCIHPISGDVVGLRDFAKLLGDQRFYGIQVPKEKMNAQFGGSIELIAETYVDLLVAFQPDGPFALAGWSAGAIIALEMARQLRGLGREVPLLVALDGAPCNTGAGLKVWYPLYTLKLIANLPRWIRDDREQDWSWRGIYNRLEGKLAMRFGIGGSALPNVQTMDAETVDGLMRSSGWTPDQKAFMYAMYKAMIGYVPAPYSGRVLVFETLTQPLYHLRQIGAAWRAIASSIEVVPLRGNHSGIVSEPTIGAVARHLTARMAAVRSNNDPAMVMPDGGPSHAFRTAFTALWPPRRSLGNG